MVIDEGGLAGLFGDEVTTTLGTWERISDGGSEEAKDRGMFRSKEERACSMTCLHGWIYGFWVRVSGVCDPRPGG